MATVVYLLALIAGMIQGWITLEWYEPPPKDGEVPTPIFEAVLYTVIFALLFMGYGYVLVRVRGMSPPLTEYLLIVVSIIGGVLVFGHLTGRWAMDRDPVERFLAFVTAVVFGLFPLVVLVV